MRNPFHHSVLLVALLLSRLASASIQNRQHFAQTHIQPDAVLTDATDFVVEGATVAIVSEDWFVTDPARPVDYPRLLAMPSFQRPDEIIRVAFSSGTTGYPKAIALTLEVAENRLLNGLIAAGRETRSLNLMGLSTLSGFATPILALGSGDFVAFATDIPTAINMIRVFQLETLAAAVFQLNLFVKQLEGQAPLASLKSIGTGGAKMPPAMLAAVKQKLGPNVSFAYASTEAGTLSAARAATLEKYPGSAGYLMPWVEMQAVDGNGQKVPEGEDGIIRVRTNELARYLNQTPDPTERFGDDWFYPGDVGHVTREGLVYITGRSSEIINKGGIIVAPDLIEDAVLAAPGVKDAAVFGVTNAEGIEEIWAAVVGEGFIDTTAIRVIVGARLPDRVPDRIIEVEAIPRNIMGKISRKELKEKLVASAK